eukprot:SAG31_NODE_15_length_37942_cov_32.078297_29_plen_80_part_00
MVIISMNPKVNIQPEDVERVWAVLNPDKRDWIPFDVFVDGMIKVKADPMLSKVIQMAYITLVFQWANSTPTHVLCVLQL